MRFRWFAVFGLSAAVALAACAKKEEPAPEAPKAAAPSAQPEMPASHPPLGEEAARGPGGPGGPGGMMGGMGAAPAGPRQVVVPEEVRNTWKAVVLQVTDKASGKTEDVTIDIGKSASVGDLKITVEAFLPAFAMGAGEITSKSLETENPAVQLAVDQGGAPVYSGWLFSLFPDAHPFQNEKYGLLLKDFVKK